MKKIILVLLIVPIISSCKSAIISTHSEVMSSYNTKQKVISRFGFPTSKIVEGELEQWYYDYGNVSRTSVYVPNRRANTTVTAYNNTIRANTTYGGGTASANTTSYSRYIKFIINPSSGQVVSWNSLGVNNEKIDRKQRTKNILYPTIAVLGVAIIWYVLDMAAFEKELDQEDYDYYND